MGNTWGHTFKITTWGESHCPSTGVIIDGCPPGLPLSEKDIQKELERRRPNQSNVTSTRNEADKAEILSGIHNGVSLGTPIAILIKNTDTRPQDYKNIKTLFRPSHADFTYREKYGQTQPSGGGRASARETAARVAAGAVAKKILRIGAKVKIQAFVDRVQAIAVPAGILTSTHSTQAIENSLIRCPHPETAKKMIAHIEEIKAQGNSVGGSIFCTLINIPAGLGAPVFDKLEADLAKAMLSIPAVKGFEIGSGFEGTYLTGAQHNDTFIRKDHRIGTKTNNSGGIQGGISNGEPITFRVAFKPTATIALPQETLSHHLEPTTIKVQGRHDPCVLPRAVPIVEAMAALTLVDHWLRHHAQTKTFSFKAQTPDPDESVQVASLRGDMHN